MNLPPLIDGTILKRYKRFLADVELPDGRVVTAHCPNTGSMLGCWRPGAPVQLSHSDNPRRKLAWTLERVDMGQGWIGVHTGRTNSVVGEALRAGRIVSLAGYREIRSEVAFDPPGFERARFDFMLNEGPGPDIWIEVKNVTLWQGGRLLFPDAVTQRGVKHLELLAEASRRGYRAVMLYALNRPEGSSFSVADEIDPVYGATLRRVIKQAGVEVLAYRIEHQQQTMQVTEAVEVDLN
ncbi:MAG: DNA/RNA nuclease SfsA [Gammaproteobacteria bacterium]|nr:DNA/RNA nuclease SfsA [Gammaproteobacteria bacterium]